MTFTHGSFSFMSFEGWTVLEKGYFSVYSWTILQEYSCHQNTLIGIRILVLKKKICTS